MDEKTTSDEKLVQVSTWWWRLYNKLGWKLSEKKKEKPRMESRIIKYLALWNFKAFI